MTSGLVIGRRDHDRIGARQHTMERATCHDFVHDGIGLAAARDADDAGAKGTQDAGDLAPDRPQANNNDSAGRWHRELRCEGAIPRVPRLIGIHSRDVPLQREQKSDRVGRN